ncbi:MAG: CHRD domain-containing protein [Acidimicrobiia bacterium]|nr:CHRD domain-containing protein [Acidimicrobiia bacterium]
MLVGGTVSAGGGSFRTHLSGDNEVPAVETQGQGQALFKISEDGASIDYKLIVANTDDLVQAHIHLAPAGTNGSVVAFLFGPVAEGTNADGVLATGTITVDDLIGPLAGEPLSEFIDAMGSGGAYVNVHTLDNPGGEIRGQIDG